MKLNFKTLNSANNNIYNGNIINKQSYIKSSNTTFGKKEETNTKEKKKSHLVRNIAIVIGAIAAFCGYAISKAKDTHSSFGGLWFGKK